jgi:hypothetical protein
MVAWGGYISGVGTLLLLLLFSLISPFAITTWWPFTLTMVLLGLALIVGGRRLSRVPAPSAWDEKRPSPLTWITAGGWAVVIAVIIVYPFVGAALANVQVAVVMIESLTQFTAPPPGVDWLVNLLASYGELQGEITGMILAASFSIGGLIGYLIYLFVPRRRRQTVTQAPLPNRS